MRTLRRKLMMSYANLDLPIKWKDEQVALVAGKTIKTRRDAMAFKSNMYAAYTSNSNLRWFPEFKWFTGMTDLLRYAFRYCPNLEEIELPRNLTFIGAQCFDGDVKLGPDFVIPSKVAKIDWYAFHGCTGIKRFRVLNPTPATIGADCFPTTARLYVPDGSLGAYKAASVWGDMADRIHPLSEWSDE